jgi:hypothetical protein
LFESSKENEVDVVVTFERARSERDRGELFESDVDNEVEVEFLPSDRRWLRFGLGSRAKKVSKRSWKGCGFVARVEEEGLEVDALDDACAESFEVLQDPKAFLEASVDNEIEMTNCKMMLLSRASTSRRCEPSCSSQTQTTTLKWLFACGLARNTYSLAGDIDAKLEFADKAEAFIFSAFPLGCHKFVWVLCNQITDSSVNIRS